MQRLRATVGLIVFLLLCLGAGGLGALATTPEIGSWYSTLNKPTWNPPAWVFGPVWTTLYVLIAISGWLAWKANSPRPAVVPLTLYAVQLLLNIAWSWIFFRCHQPGWAVVEIVVLWFTILATAIAFFRRSRVAALLLVPYLAWVSFATVLNFTIWRLNS